jgi:hypothetical protein
MSHTLTLLREALKRMAEEERKERDLMAALDTGLASRRAKPGVWDRVSTKIRRAFRLRRASLLVSGETSGRRRSR